MTGPVEQSVRPPDVDTGFWLWLIALPLMVAGYVIDLVAVQVHPNGLVLAISLVFAGIVTAIVATFMVLMRQGYRWTRTVLTGGAIASAAYSVSNLFGEDRSPAVAVSNAVCVIVGSVLIAGGVYLLHRKDSQAFFTR